MIFKTLFQTNKINKMKFNLSIAKTFSVRTLLIITFITIGFANFTKCDGQSIEGKWKVISVKLFLNTGGAFEHPIPAGDIYQFEFKPDHTYVVTDGPGSTSMGTWSVSGSQLTMIAPAEQRKGLKGRTSNFSITGNKMRRTIIADPPYNKTQSKSEETSIRM
jgi:Lipocalin-like domain